MAGKRPRQIHRTTSLSQLGPGLQLLDSTRMTPGRPKTPAPAGAPQPPGPQIVQPPPTRLVEDVLMEEAAGEHGIGVAEAPALDAEPGNRAIVPPSPAYAEESMALDLVEELAVTKSEESTAIRQGAVSPVPFLQVCFLCKRRLRQGKDIFMYRGDRAFCSIECRCHQIAADERRERCKISSVKKGTGASAANSSSTGQVVSKETAAAA